MACKPFADKLEAYCLGMLSAEEKARVQQHVQTCGPCQRKLALHQKAVGLIAKAFDQNPPDDLRSKVMAHLQDVKAQKTHWGYWAAPGLVSVAVLLLIIKIQPGQIVKKQAMEAARVKQESTPPMPSAPQLAQQPKIELAGKVKAAKETTKKKASAGLAETKPLANIAAAIESEETKDVRQRSSKYPADEYLFAPAAAGMPPAVALESGPEKRGEYGAPAEAGDARLSRAQAVPPVMLSEDAKTDDAIKAGGPMKSEALGQPKAGDNKKVMAPLLSLVEIKGEMDRAQVLRELGKLNHMLADRIKQDGEVKTVRMTIAVDRQGKIISPAFAGPAFNSSQLNQYIIDEIKTLHFDQPQDSLPATVIIAIEVK